MTRWCAPLVGCATTEVAICQIGHSLGDREIIAGLYRHRLYIWILAVLKSLLAKISSTWPAVVWGQEEYVSQMPA